MNRFRCCLLLWSLMMFWANARSEAAVGSVAFEDRVKVDVARNRKVRIAGGDWDDKLDRIAFTIKLSNSDNVSAFNDCKLEFYVFAQSILNPKAYKLLGKEAYTCSLPPRGSQQYETAEVVTQYDTTGARFGAKYDGWVFVVRDNADKVIFTKSSQPSWLPGAGKMNTLSVESFYQRDLTPVKNPLY